jgi:hypothetical protein
MNDLLKSLPVNWGIVAHPLNWLTVALMVTVPLIAAHEIIRWKRGTDNG